MNEENLKLAQQDIDEVLKTVEELEVQIDALSKDDLKEKFATPYYSWRLQPLLSGMGRSSS